MSLILYLIRHGTTEWSLSGQHTGSTDIPLTGRGEDEARELRHRLGGITFAHVLTSPRQRAQHTCELAGMGSSVEIIPDLVEWNYGDYEGRRSVDIIKERPGWNLYCDGCPHGESPAQVSDRADQIIARLRALDGNVAIFSHGQFGNVLAARWIGLPIVTAQHFTFSPASFSVLAYDHHHTEVSVIEMWNQTPPRAAEPPRDGIAMPLKQRAIERWGNEDGEIPIKQENSS